MKDELDAAIYRQRLRDFVEESNKIEGIPYTGTNEVDCFRGFLELPKLGIPNIQNFVHVCAPGAELRTKIGMNVRVGNHRPPEGCPGIRGELQEILDWANSNHGAYHSVHHAYETLHPFMDGNGRSGRAIWAWMRMKKHGELPSIPFLQCWYYDSLESGQ